MQKDGQLRDGLFIKTVHSLYDKTQVANWLSRIKFPGNWSADNVDTFETTLDNLSLLLRLQIVAFSFENTAMHYTSHHSVDISPSGLYQRLVVEGKGSYCFGMNSLFLQMIRALGYRAYSGAGRINIASPDSPPDFLTFVHQILFVQPFKDSNTTYLVDAGGGGSCLTRPILLKPGAKVLGATPSEWHTLVKTSRVESSLECSPGSTETPKVEWRLIVSHTSRTGSDLPSTRILYSFLEDEFFSTDYEFPNIGIYTGVWTARESLWHENVVCSRCFWLSDDEMALEVGLSAASDRPSPQGDVYSEGGTLHWNGSLKTRYLGHLGLHKNELKRHVGTRSETVETFRTELERIVILREFFGIDISPEDIENIRGRIPALEFP